MIGVAAQKEGDVGPVPYLHTEDVLIEGSRLFDIGNGDSHVPEAPDPLIPPDLFNDCLQIIYAPPSPPHNGLYRTIDFSFIFNRPQTVI